ncbi:hypothetical protein HID58_011546 [Brassica napus]|uniref:F-box domain-containing protein n=1 Tax=Brassica napus TaxID=3708 RepID=A0ABQ8DYJ8_BRANA|nr:hypothetical protein HID58_011546 [Brassica napus]
MSILETPNFSLKKHKTMTIISDLSWDLVEKILSRVPIISLGAVRSTCKRWNRLSKNRLLCKAEARRHQFLRFMVKNYKLCSVRFDLHGILDGEEFVDPSIKEITVVDSFNQVKDKEENKTSLVVWNPYLGQTRWIQARNDYNRLDLYALGYDNNRKHKILRFLDTGSSYKRFGPPLSLPVEHYVGDTGALSSLRDEKLAVLYQPTSMSDVQIWVTTKIEPSAVSWVPFLKIDVEPFTGFGFQFHHDGASFFIDEEKKVVVVFQIDESEMTCYDTAYLIGENGYFEKVGLGEAEKPQWSANNVGEYCPLVCSCSFVPSLVHINNESAGS